MDLDGKTALIVGAGRGIGRSVAELFAAENANVVISSRNEAELLELEYKLATKGSPGILVKAGDATNEQDVDLLVEETIARFERIDFLILAAGKGILKSFEDLTKDDLEEMFSANTTSAFVVLQKVLPIMKDQRFGRVAAIPGILGKAPMMQAAAYCASKYALTGMIKCLKEEYKRFGIRFSLAHLGGVDTPFWDDIDMRIDRSKLLTVNAAAEAVFNAVTQPGEGVMAEVVLMPESHQLV